MLRCARIEKVIPTSGRHSLVSSRKLLGSQASSWPFIYKRLKNSNVFSKHYLVFNVKVNPYKFLNFNYCVRPFGCLIPLYELCSLEIIVNLFKVDAYAKTFGSDETLVIISFHKKIPWLGSLRKNFCLSLLTSLLSSRKFNFNFKQVQYLNVKNI